MSKIHTVRDSLNRGKLALRTTVKVVKETTKVLKKKTRHRKEIKVNRIPLTQTTFNYSLTRTQKVLIIILTRNARTYMIF